jgi:hypothetical protein
MSVVHVPTVYRYRTEAEIAAEAHNPPQPWRPSQRSRQSDAALATLDQLTDKDNCFPAELGAVEKKYEALVSQELDSLEAIQSRSAEASKLSAMLELARLRQKRLKTAITAQEAIVIKIGSQATSLAQQLWSSLHREAFDQARAEFDRLFFRAFEHPDVLDRYKPLALLQWLKVPDLFVSSPDIKITRFRQLRERADKLKEFGEMTFAQVSERLEELDRESRERAQQVRKIGSEPVLREPGN